MPIGWTRVINGAFREDTLYADSCSWRVVSARLFRMKHVLIHIKLTLDAPRLSSGCALHLSPLDVRNCSLVRETSMVQDSAKVPMSCYMRMYASPGPRCTGIGYQSRENSNKHALAPIATPASTRAWRTLA